MKFHGEFFISVMLDYKWRLTTRKAFLPLWTKFSFSLHWFQLIFISGECRVSTVCNHQRNFLLQQRIDNDIDDNWLASYILFCKTTEVHSTFWLLYRIAYLYSRVILVCPFSLEAKSSKNYGWNNARISIVFFLKTSVSLKLFNCLQDS